MKFNFEVAAAAIEIVVVVVVVVAMIPMSCSQKICNISVFEIIRLGSSISAAPTTNELISDNYRAIIAEFQALSIECGPNNWPRASAAR